MSKAKVKEETKKEEPTIDIDYSCLVSKPVMELITSNWKDLQERIEFEKDGIQDLREGGMAEELIAIRIQGYILGWVCPQLCRMFLGRLRSEKGYDLTDFDKKVFRVLIRDIIHTALTQKDK